VTIRLGIGTLIADILVVDYGKKITALLLLYGKLNSVVVSSDKRTAVVQTAAMSAKINGSLLLQLDFSEESARLCACYRPA